MAGTERKPIVLGLTGFKRSGKDTAGKYLQQVYSTELGSFAEPIYRMLQAMLKHHRHDVAFFGREAAETQDKNALIPPFGVSLRSMLQTLGTEWGRTFVSDTVWIDLARSWMSMAYKKHSYLIVFTDVRFPNEARFIKEQGGYVLRIVGKNSQEDTHISEAGIPDELVDYVVDNQGTLQELRSNLLSVIEVIDNERS